MTEQQRKRLVGRVTSDQMDKTVVVTVERLQRHPLYKKVIRRDRRFMAHNEGNQAREGDLVRIIESRPLSRRKRWVVEEIIAKSALREGGGSPTAGSGEKARG